jgi:hypothetical protein
MGEEEGVGQRFVEVREDIGYLELEDEGIIYRQDKGLAAIG